VSALRLAFYFIGWLGLPLFFQPIYGKRYQVGLWKTYVEMAWRNPTNGMKGWFAQPVPEDKPNPDDRVRGIGGRKSDSRWMKHGLYFEYWYLRQIDWKIFKKHYRWFEFRFGWKFVDGNDEFFPTIQLGPRSS
jgi:hypothetical protein